MLQSPAEANARSPITRTVPLLRLVLPDPGDLTLLTAGRGHEDDAAVRAVLEGCGGGVGRQRWAFVLYPQPGAQELRAAVAEEAVAEEEQEGGSGGSGRKGSLLLVFLDGTWVRACLPAVLVLFVPHNIPTPRLTRTHNAYTTLHPTHKKTGGGTPPVQPDALPARPPHRDPPRLRRPLPPHPC